MVYISALNSPRERQTPSPRSTLKIAAGCEGLAVEVALHTCGPGAEEAGGPSWWGSIPGASQLLGLLGPWTLGGGARAGEGGHQALGGLGV